MRLDKPLNRYIDHTLLSPMATDAEFEKLLDQAVENDFYSVCVSPYIAIPVAQALKPHPTVKVCTVVGFPQGNLPVALKLEQVAFFALNGVHEIDWVLHYAEFFNERWGNVAHELKSMADFCRQSGVVSKCIVETSALKTQENLERVFRMVQEAGVDFIKTSTGFNGEGAQLEHIQLWNKLRDGSPTPQIKASAGIKTAEKALAMIEAGADRLGMSASVEVMAQYRAMQEEK